jgi:hypothetical protein
MMKVLLSVFVLVCVLGCQTKAGEESTNQPVSQTSPVEKAEGVAPMASGAASGLSPVSGSESVQGAGGGGVGSAAKDMARRKTQGSGDGSSSQMSAEDGQ